MNARGIFIEPPQLFVSFQTTDENLFMHAFGHIEFIRGDYVLIHAPSVLDDLNTADIGDRPGEQAYYEVLRDLGRRFNAKIEWVQIVYWPMIVGIE